MAKLSARRLVYVVAASRCGIIVINAHWTDDQPASQQSVSGEGEEHQPHKKTDDACHNLLFQLHSLLIHYSCGCCLCFFDRSNDDAFLGLISAAAVLSPS